MSTDLKQAQSELKNAKNELKSTKSELKSTESELKTTECDLKSTENELKSTECELKSTKSELKITKSELKGTESELKSTESELKTTESELKSTESELKGSQEESYHRLLELEVLYRAAPVGLGFLDRELRYVRVNEALANMNGLPVEAHIGQHAMDINPPLAKLIVPKMEEVIESKQPVLNVEITGTTPADKMRKRTWMASFSPVTNAKTFGVSVVFQDITLLKENQDISTRLSLIVESSSDAIISTALDGTITSWNRAAEGTLGYTSDEVVGKPFSILVTPQNAHEVPDILGRLQQERVRHGERIETVHRRKDGRYINVSLSISPIHDRHGCLIGASKIVRDITLQKSAHSALLRSDEEHRQFAFAAAHDLQEPLRNIILYAQILKARSEPSADVELDELSVVTESATRMQMLIKDLLLYTEVIDVPSGMAQPVDCNEACRAALSNLASAIDECAAEVNVGQLPTVIAERSHVIQLIQNLIGNALKYRGEERPPHIEVSAEREDHQWVFSVKDNGIGIAPKFHDQIFGVFKRLHGHEIPGTGIGLALCKRIVDHQGGRLWLESESGMGSTFYFSFPDRN